MHAERHFPEGRGSGRTPFTDADEPAIDLVHLARQTDGDTALEAELLSLFDRQSAVSVERLTGEGARAGAADIAHKLRGSALAIGAGRVASAARAVETLLSSDLVGAHERERAIRGLAIAVAEARGVVAELLG